MHFITMPWYHTFYISRLYIAEVLFIDIYPYQWHHSLTWLSPCMWTLTLSHTACSPWRWGKQRFHTLSQFCHWASPFWCLPRLPLRTHLLFFIHITVDSSSYSLLLNFSLSNLLPFLPSISLVVPHASKFCRAYGLVLWSWTTPNIETESLSFPWSQ